MDLSRLHSAVLFFVFMFSQHATGQVSHNVTSGETSVTLAKAEGPASTSAAISVSKDKTALVIGAGPAQLSIELLDDAGKPVLDSVSIEGARYTLDFISTDHVIGSAAISAGLKLDGLPRAVLDALRGKCKTIQVKAPFILRSIDREEQDVIIMPQQTTAKNNTGLCNVTVSPDLSVELNFELAGFCDDKAKKLPPEGSSFASIMTVSPCVTAKIEESLSLLTGTPMRIAYGGIASESVQTNIWQWNAECATEDLSCDDVLAVYSLHGDELHQIFALRRATAHLPGARQALDLIEQFIRRGERVLVIMLPEGVWFVYRVNSKKQIATMWAEFDLDESAKELQNKCFGVLSGFAATESSDPVVVKFFDAFQTEYGTEIYASAIQAVRHLDSPSRQTESEDMEP